MGLICAVYIIYVDNALIPLFFALRAASRPQGLYDKYHMWTNWYVAGAIQQLDENQIAYTDGSGILDLARNVVTRVPVRGLHLGQSKLLAEEPNGLVFKGFGFSVVGTVQGCEVLINSQRLGRIQDRSIQLYYQAALGENRSVEQPEDRQIYGGVNDLWGVQNFSLWNDPEFGVLVDLQPHVSIPSSNLVTIYSVQMRLWVV